MKTFGMLCCSLLSAFALAGVSAAKTVAIPDKQDPAFTVEVPSGWTTEVDEGVLTASEPDDNAFVSGFVLDDVEEVEEALKSLKEIIGESARNVVYDKAVETMVNGMEALQLTARGVYREDGEKVKIQANLYSLSEDRVGMLFGMAYAAAGADVSSAMKNMFKSVEATGNREEEAEEDAEEEEEEEDGGGWFSDGDDGESEGDDEDVAEEEEESEYPAAEVIELEPGRWQVVTELGDVIYSSLLVTTATLRQDALGLEPDPQVLGDQLGMVGVVIHAPRDNCPVEVEISSSDYIQPSRYVGTLAEDGVYYTVWPVLKYDFGKLLALRQTVPETLTIKVTVDGQAGEEVRRMQVRPINECVFGFVDEDGPTDLSWTFAAYVNENHPFIDEILRAALDSGDVDNFAGYQKDRKGVRKEIKAVWNALQNRGFRYSNITTTSGGEDNVFTQHVRLMGDALKTSQANCVDGSVLMASILRKLGIDVYLVCVPSHMFIAASLDEEDGKIIGIETTMLGNSTFEEAVKVGSEQLEEAGDKFEDPEELDYQLININSARQLGIIPIKDVAGEAAVSPAPAAGQ